MCHVESVCKCFCSRFLNWARICLSGDSQATKHCTLLAFAGNPCVAIHGWLCVWSVSVTRILPFFSANFQVIKEIGKVKIDEGKLEHLFESRATEIKPKVTLSFSELLHCEQAINWFIYILITKKGESIVIFSSLVFRFWNENVKTF